MEHYLPVASWIYFVYNAFRIAILSHQCFAVPLGNGRCGPGSRIPLSGAAQDYADFCQQKPVNVALGAGCASRRRSCSFDFVSPEELPCHVKQGRACCRGLMLVLCVGGMLSPGCKIDLPGVRRWWGGCLPMQTCLFCENPAGGWSVIPTSREGVQAAPLHCLSQRGPSSLLYLLWCPQHCSPVGAVGGHPVQGLAVCAGLAGVELLLLGAMTLSSHNQVGQQGSCEVHCEKSGLLTKRNLKGKWNPPFLLIKINTYPGNRKKTFLMRCVWRISVFTKNYFTARNLSCPGNKGMCFKGTGKLCTFQVTSL